MNTAAQVRAHADVMELDTVDFLDEHGRRVSLDCIVRATQVRLGFIDGTAFDLTTPEFDLLADYNFRLRSIRADA